MLYLQNVPEVIAGNKTILIPKSDNDLDKIDNYRSITISSILIRTVNKIIDNRLKLLPINVNQRGFSNIDGCFLTRLNYKL